MAYRFQPQNAYGGAIAPAIPTSSLLGQVLGITALGLCITAGASWLLGGVISYGVGLIATIVPSAHDSDATT